MGGGLSSCSLSSLKTVVVGAGGELGEQGGWDVILSVNMGLKP